MVADNEIEVAVGEFECLDIDAMVACVMWHEVAGDVLERRESDNLGLKRRLWGYVQDAHLRRVDE